jgi:uncharacterized protein (DUF1697 family)
MTYVALLRGINVGGKNQLPMKLLAEWFAEEGCSGVRTYIQSGNVVFRASQSVAARIPRRVSAQIAERFGYKVPLVMRSADEMGQVIGNNPFLKRGVAEQELHVMFLADLPVAGGVANLDPGRSAPGAFEVRGREIYLRLPNGAGRSKLTNAYFDSKLATVSTSRNWRTVTTLVEMMQR